METKTSPNKQRSGYIIKIGTRLKDLIESPDSCIWEWFCSWHHAGGEEGQAVVTETVSFRHIKSSKLWTPIEPKKVMNFLIL